MTKKLPGWIFLLFLIVVSLFLARYAHRNSGVFNWKSEIWADKAGYYIYLPSLFMYRFDASRAPDRIDEKTGYGFTIDREKNKIITKYTYGVAAMVSPFFILARLVSPLFDMPGESGFGTMFHLMVNLAAVFYLVLGIFFLRKFLLYYFNSGLTYVILFLIYAGTNLLFYATEDTLMSHVYSFFLFSLFLVSMKRYLEDKSKWSWFILMSVAFAMSVLIRPTNGIILALFFLWDCDSRNEIRDRIVVFFRPSRLIVFLFIVLLFFLPQMIYWKYSRGSFIAWSYTNEGFSNWHSPRIAEVWFSPLNGLFIYTPLIVLMIAGMIIMIRRKISNGWISLGLFLCISYLFASWYNWYFGCSFGQRSYVEFYAVFSVPLGFSLVSLGKIRNLLIKSLAVILIIFMIWYNLKMMLSFEKCFFGSTWDWAQFERQLGKAQIFISHEKVYSFENDFENGAISYSNKMSDTVSRSGMQSMHIIPEKEFHPCYSVMLNDLGVRLPETINISYWAVNPLGWPVEASLVCSLDINDSVVSWQSAKLPPLTDNSLTWKEVRSKFIIPGGISRDPRIRIYFWNPQHNSFFVDDLKIEFK